MIGHLLRGIGIGQRAAELACRQVQPQGATLVLGAALELYASVREHAAFMPDPVLAEAARFRALVAEHVEIVP